MNKGLAFLLTAPLWHYSAAQQPSPPPDNSTVVTTFNTGQSFSCVAVDTSFNVWAGTNKKGLFYLNSKANPKGGTFDKLATGEVDFKDFEVTSIAADNLANIWVGHVGIGFGAIEQFNSNSLSHIKQYRPDINGECFTSIDPIREGLATSKCKSIAVDGVNTVWSAHLDDNLPGSICYKRVNNKSFTARSMWVDLKKGKESPELPYPAYVCNVPIQKTPLGRNCNSIACGKSEIWLSVYPYEYATTRGPILHNTITTAYHPARILIYDLNGIFKKQLTFESVGAKPGGVFNSICITKNENVWVGLTAQKGFAARINGCWTLIDATKMPSIFQPEANVNANAIWANNKGEIFIGTTKGLIVFNGVGKVDDASSYTLYTTATSNISSDNVLGGVNVRDTVQWVATDNGLTRIKSTVNFSLSPDYTSCRNEHINSIEKQFKTDLSDRHDFHSYVVETVICDKSGPNDTKCNAQAVYALMKSNVAFQAPSPKIFTHDNLKLNVLAQLSEEEKNEILVNVNAWKEDMAKGNEYGGIKEIRQVLPLDMIFKYYCSNTSPLNPMACFDKGQLLPFTGFIDSKNRADYEMEQAQANEGHTKVESCSTVYKLYNSYNHVADRGLFWGLDRMFCGAKLGSIKYDPVRLFADDQNLTITNYTMEGHFLDPGKVKRFVVEECDKVKVVTIGTGLNYCAEGGTIPDVITDAERIAFNIQFGPKNGMLLSNVLTASQKKIFKALGKQLAIQNGNGNIILGSIMFKNIDMLLKQGFEASK